MSADLKNHWCVGAENVLNPAIPISLKVENGKVDRVICPYFVRGKCTADIADTAELRETKKKISIHSQGKTAEEYPGCLYASPGITMV